MVAVPLRGYIEIVIYRDENQSIQVAVPLRGYIMICPDRPRQREIPLLWPWISRRENRRVSGSVAHL